MVEKWTAKDILGVAFSTAALVLSAVGFYMSNVRVEDSVLARIVDTRVDPVSPDDNVRGYRNGVVVAQMSFINNGNRSAVILAPSYRIGGTIDRSDISWGDIGDYNAADFPRIILPGEIRFIELRIPMKAFLSNMEHGAEAIDDPNNHDGTFRRLYAGFEFHSIGSSGRLEHSSSGVQMVVTVSPDGWKGLGPIKEPAIYSDDSFTPTQLFE